MAAIPHPGVVCKEPSGVQAADRFSPRGLAQRSSSPRRRRKWMGNLSLSLADDWKPPRPNVRYPYPPNLESYLARNLAPHELVADLDAIGARHDWDQAVSRLSAEWWPARYYAHWRTPWDNPSHPFVAACLRWRLGDVEPDQWIPGAPQAIYRTGFHPLELTSNPLWTEQAAFLSELENSLSQAMYDGAIDSGWLLATYERARQKATEAYYAAEAQASAEYVFVQVFPGILRKDWEQLWDLLSRQGEGRDDLHKWVIELREEGKGDLTIANLLGMKRSTVQSIRG